MSDNRNTGRSPLVWGPSFDDNKVVRSAQNEDPYEREKTSPYAWKPNKHISTTEGPAQEPVDRSIGATVNNAVDALKKIYGPKLENERIKAGILFRKANELGEKYSPAYRVAKGAVTGGDVNLKDLVSAATPSISSDIMRDTKGFKDDLRDLGTGAMEFYGEPISRGINSIRKLVDRFGR